MRSWLVVIVLSLSLAFTAVLGAGVVRAEPLVSVLGEGFSPRIDGVTVVAPRHSARSRRRRAAMQAAPSSARPGTGSASAFRAPWQSHGLESGDPGVSFRESLALFGYPISVDRDALLPVHHVAAPLTRPHWSRCPVPTLPCTFSPVPFPGAAQVGEGSQACVKSPRSFARVAPRGWVKGQARTATVPPAGFEPATCGLEGRRSIR